MLPTSRRSPHPHPSPEFDARCAALCLGRRPSSRRRSLGREDNAASVAGVDEVGRGPLAGPVIAAAVILHRAPLPVRIDDSKRLTPAQRLSAYRVILRSAEIGIGIVPADVIDASNIRQATLQAMRRAIERLPSVPALVLVDGNDPPAVPMACRAIIRGDQQSYAIACASIVAKVTRDALMRFYHRLFPGYAFHRHYGYGTEAHLAALQRLGPSPMHRATFAPIARLSDAVQC